jgi:copper transport protein
MRRALLLAALVALVLPASAAAHASLEKTSPKFRQTLANSPRRVVLKFDEPVYLLPNAIRVLLPDGRNVVTRQPRVIKSKQELLVALPRLRTGPYTVRWQALSDDGHVVSGVFTFGVRVRAPLVTDAVGAQGPTRAEDIVRWLYFVGLALVVGGLGFRLLVVRGPLNLRAQRRFFWVVGTGIVIALETGIVAFLLRGEDALQLSFSRFLYGDLSPLASGTRPGDAFIVMELAFALVAALLYLAWLLERVELLWAAFALGLVFVGGLSLSGHDAVGPGDSKWSELADYVHVCAAVLWVGGLVQLAVVVWPAQADLRRVAFLRFSRLATVLVAVLVGAGTYLSIVRLPRLHDLWTTGYGHDLLVKLGLVCLALGWGAAHHFLAVPRIDRDGVAGRLSRTIAGESAVAMAVLLAAAILTDSKPPPQPLPGKPPAAAVSRR